MKRVLALSEGDPMTHWRHGRSELERMDRDMVKWRNAVLTVSGVLIGAGLAMLIWVMA